MNVIEVIFSPLYYFTSRRMFKTINYYVMMVLYLPFLVYITVTELATARKIQYNRYKGLADDANENNWEWNLTDGYEVDASLSWEGIQTRNAEINQALQEQREGEAVDPEFCIDDEQFHKDIDKVVKPVKIASKKGIKWEFYDLHEKIDRITKLVEATVTENELLKGELKGVVKTEQEDK